MRAGVSVGTGRTNEGLEARIWIIGSSKGFALIYKLQRKFRRAIIGVELPVRPSNVRVAAGRYPNASRISTGTSTHEAGSESAAVTSVPGAMTVVGGCE